MKIRVDVVVGGQYGSEGKGAVAARLAQRVRELGGPVSRLVAVRVAGPNAGHTVVGTGGKAWALRQVPVPAVSHPDCRLYIAPGSEIDPEVLWDEVSQLDLAGYNVSQRLVVSPEATVIEQHHKQQEAQLRQSIGSTGKGIGAARAARLMRTAVRWGEYDHPARRLLEGSPEQVYPGATHLIIEGTQGIGLGLRAGHYPYCTSSDTRAVDFLAMAGVVDPWAHNVKPWLVVRPYPIRVAGNSGPLEGETTWGQLGLPEELTTVTKKVRRVGAWDPELIARAVAATTSAGSLVDGALTMADQVWPELTGRDGVVYFGDLPAGLRMRMEDCLELGLRVRLIGTGPATMQWVIW